MSTFYPLPKLCPNCNEYADECDLSCLDEDREYAKRERKRRAERRAQWWSKVCPAHRQETATGGIR